MKIKNVTINSNRMAGSVVGQLYGNIENCHVDGAEISVVPNAVGDSYDNGDKVGGIVGWLGDNGNNRNLAGCSVNDVEITAYRDIGGIAGYVASSTNVKNNSVAKTTVTVDQLTNYYGDEDVNAGLIWGRKGGDIVEAGNSTDSESTITATYKKDGVVLRENGVTNDVVLAGVPADYPSKTLTVPAGVTRLGNKVLAGNTTIKEVVIPEGLTNFGGTPNATGTGASGGFFYQSAVEKITLPEGLTEIPAAAFNQAANLKEVNIPNSVTTIGINAFAGSGLETLEILSTVTSIGYGAFRDMESLETATIEGNVKIPAYAFRSCTNLKTVVLKGDNVTFDAGQIFTNYDTGNGSAITVYVANETVKERLMAADSAATNYGGYTIIIGIPQ